MESNQPEKTVLVFYSLNTTYYTLILMSKIVFMSFRTICVYIYIYFVMYSYMLVSAKDPITALRELLSFLRGIYSTDAVRSVCNMWLGSQSIWTADEEPSQVCDPNVFVTP